MADVRKLLGMETPDILKVDVNADEKKYKIGTVSRNSSAGFTGRK